MTTNQKTPTERVLEKIEQGTVHMRSRSYFYLRVAASLFVALTVFLISVLVASFVLYSLHESGELFLLGFGFSGVMTFFLLFPWGLFFIDIGAILLLRYLVRGFRSVYRLSFLTVLVVIMGASTVLALGITLTPFHSSLRERADTDDLPFLAPLYHGIRAPHEARGEFRGIIESIDNRTFVIVNNDRDRDSDDGRRTILIPETIDITSFAIGDELYGGGEERHGIIHAYGVVEIIPSSK